ARGTLAGGGEGMPDHGTRSGHEGKHQGKNWRHFQARRGSRAGVRGWWGSDAPEQTGTGAPPSLVQRALGDPPSGDAVRQLQDAFGRPPRKPGESPEIGFDYDDVVQQSFPASDPPPPPG